MNKQCYRVVFNKARGMMMVVSEITKSKTKSAGDSKRGNTATSSTSTQPADTFSYRRLVMAVLCCQSMIYTQVQAATSAIQNTASSIPTAQRAALLKATNGTPIVNIRTPNSKGLSHNTYNQFDIGSNGAILNNSLGGVNTQLAGAIAGNQYLAQGVANTILNEVRSSAPVKFEGNLEVAGQRADVIIASPSGLQVQGGGFINANRATLTTGTPKIDSAGNLTGFDVKQGQIQFDNAATGNALGGDLYDGKNKNQANYVDVLARAVMINGQIHANQDVDIITGSNTVDYDTGTAKTIVGTGTRPTLAVDVSALGGIYANSINLVGTENGLGVRNAGNIKAAQQIVLTNSGKIENTSAIETTKAQTSLVSINATGTTGGIEHSGKISSYGMIDIQADRDISLDNGIVYKRNASRVPQLMPDIVNIDAKLKISLKNKSSIRNFEDKADTSIYMHSRGSTTVDTESMIGSEGGVSMDAGGYMTLQGKSTVFARKAPLVIHSNSTAIIDDTLVSSRDALYISADDGSGNRPANAVVRNNARLYADKDITINAAKGAYLLTGSQIVKSDDLHVTAAKSVTVQDSGKIDVGGNAVFTAAETAYINRNSKPINIGKKLIIDSGQTTVLNSTANAIEGIDISSQGKDTTITNSHLNSEKGAVTAIARQAALTVKNLNTDANSTILAATGDVSIAGSNLKADSIVIESGKNMTLTSVTANAKDKNNAGDVVLQSDGKVDITSSHLNSGKRLAIDSKGFLSLHGSELNAANNLELEGYRIYSNTVLSQNSEGKYYHDFEVNNEQSKLTAGDALLLDSVSSQYYTNTDLTGSAIVSNSTRGGHGLSDNLNITATGDSKDVDEEVNGDIQISNKYSVHLDNRHKLNAKNDVVINADKSIRLNKVADLSADRIYLKTNIKDTAKNTKGIYNTSGDGHINIYNSNIKTRSTKDNSFTVDAANHLNLINANINSAGTSTLKSGNLMRVNNSTIDADKHLNINSDNQLIFNGARTANTNTGLTHTAGNTTLKAGQIVSIDSNAAQSYKDINVTGGAVLINSANSIGFVNPTNSTLFGTNLNPSINATGSTKLATSKEKLLDGKAVSTLNGDLSIISNSNLTIDPRKVSLHSMGDINLTSREGKLYLKGHSEEKGGWDFGSFNKVVNITTPGNINLTGKEVLIEGAVLTNGINLPWNPDYSEVDWSSPSYQVEADKITADYIKTREDNNKLGINTTKPVVGSVNITATNGSVELKGIKDKINDSIGGVWTPIFHVSQHRVQVIEDQIKLANAAIISTRADTTLSTQNKNIEIAKLQSTLSDLNKILEISKKPSRGYEYKAVEIDSYGTVNVSAQNGGVLMEATDVTSRNGGINILAKGNLKPVTFNDDKREDTYSDSIRITGLVDVFEQGNVSEGNITGSNYSYHQIVNQPKLTAKGNIQISGEGNLAKSSDKYDAITKTYISNNSVVLNSVDIVSTNGNVRIDASTGDIDLETSQMVFLDGSQHTSTSRKWYGKKKTKTTTVTSNNSNAVTTDIQAKNIGLTADGSISIYGSELVAAPTGTINISAGKLLNLYAIDNVNESNTDIQKRSSWLGARYNKDHTNDTRQELSQLPATLIGGKAYTASGGSTLLEGTVFKTLKPADIKVGVGKYADNAAQVILAPITNQITTTHTQDRESTVWMKTVDQGSVVTTAALPKFNQAPTITSPNGVVVVVPVEVTVESNKKAKEAIQLSQAQLGKIALDLSKQPGYEYLATLDKTNDINWVQVDLIQKNWDYTQEGLTPGAAALIAIAITIAAGPAGSGLTASMVATNAAGIALQTQAVITLINNKGDISKTLKDMASSETIRGMATAALTAGLTAKFGLNTSTDYDFSTNLAKGIGKGVSDAAVNAAINGVSFEEALKNGLRGALVDSLAAEAFGDVIKDIDGEDFASNFAHKLAAGGLGCITASAKKQNCNAGALGSIIGESIADYYITEEMQTLINADLMPAKYINELNNKIKMVTGTIALIAGVDVDSSVNSAIFAVENNTYNKNAEAVELNESVLKVYAALTGLVLRPVAIAQFYTEYNKATTNAERQKILVNAGIDLTVAKVLAIKFTKISSCFVAGTLIETIDGLRAIETIKQGDLVWSRHEETLEYGYRPVVDTVSFDNKEIYEVVVRDNDGKLETYQTTEEHPFWVVDTGWLPASLLQIGMTLVNRDDEKVLTVISQTKLNKTDTVYNFEVADFHTYHIGEFGIWVHNANCALPQTLKNKLKRIYNETAAGGFRGVSGSVSNDEALKLGQHFVGDGYRLMTNGKGYVSADGLRIFRFPAKKSGINRVTGEPYSKTGTQANFETKTSIGEASSSNVHLDIK